jgi:hypothetical protein
MHTLVFCNFRQAGFHSWPNAPEPYKYLSYPHRHEFHVRVDVQVAYDDRDIEFIALKQACQTAFAMLTAEVSFEHLDFGARSCEMLAKELGHILVGMKYNVAAVEVSEDGENGARYQRL